jgi:hypothetical protein
LNNENEREKNKILNISFLFKEALFFGDGLKSGGDDDSYFLF